MRPASRRPRLYDQSPARTARLALPPEHRETSAERAPRAAGVHVVPERRPAQPDRIPQHRPDRFRQPPHGQVVQPLQFRERMHPRPVERFVGIDVADARHDPLAHEGVFRETLLSTKRREHRVLRGGPCVGHAKRGIVRPQRLHAAEPPHVPPVEIPFGIVQREPPARVARPRLRFWDEHELARHAEMQFQAGDAGIRRIRFEPDQNGLAVAGHAGDMGIADAFEEGG